MLGRAFADQEQNLIEELLRLRRDVRGNLFNKEPLEDEVLDRILRAALHAPSVGFSQPWRFVVIRDQATRQSIADIYQTENQKAIEIFEAEGRQHYARLKLEGILESAVNVAVYYEQQEAPVLGQTSMPQMGEYSTVCAVQNMWLMARALNVGVGWVSILDESKVSQLLNAKPQHKLVAYLCMGYVEQFHEKPELETLGWDSQRDFDAVVFSESLK